MTLDLELAVDPDRSDYLTEVLRSQSLAGVDPNLLEWLSEQASSRVVDLDELLKLNSLHVTSASLRLRHALAMRPQSARCAGSASSWRGGGAASARKASSSSTAAQSQLPQQGARSESAPRSGTAARGTLCGSKDKPNLDQPKAEGSMPTKRASIFLSGADSDGPNNVPLMTEGASFNRDRPSVVQRGSILKQRQSMLQRGSVLQPIQPNVSHDKRGSTLHTLPLEENADVNFNERPAVYDGWRSGALHNGSEDHDSDDMSSLGSDTSAARRQRNRRKADRWISETASQVGRVVGDPDLWKENHRKHVDECRHQAVVMKKLVGSVPPFPVFAEMQRREMMEKRSAAAVKLARAVEIPFREGSIFPGALCNICIASFPGMYLEHWPGLFEVSTTKTKMVASACVWLPEDDPAKRFGHHAPDVNSPGKCLCHTMYGKRQTWGCVWFKQWVKNIRNAVKLGLTLLVVFLPGQCDREYVSWESLASEGDRLWNNVGLGGSQKCEVAWLRKQGIEIRTTDVHNMHAVLRPNPAPMFVAPELHKGMTSVLRRRMQKQAQVTKQRSVAFAPSVVG